jgi:hypothetical protein
MSVTPASVFVRLRHTLLIPLNVELQQLRLNDVEGERIEPPERDLLLPT